MPNNWNVFDRIRGLASRHGVYQAERLVQNQSDLSSLGSAGDVYGSDMGGIQSSILDQTSLQLSRLERYKDYEAMDQTGEVMLALDLFADEGSLVDPERKHTLIIRAHSRRLKAELEDLFFNRLQWDNNCRPSMRYLCKFGDCPFEIVTDRNRSGVSALKHMSVYDFNRVETKHGDLAGFFHQDETQQATPSLLHPWQVMHLRLSSFENSYNPYGRAVIDGGRRAFKQLRLMEDAALVYRITRAPEKLKFTIPVGKIPHKELAEYMQAVARTFKRQKFYNPAAGTFDERYSPLIQEDNIFLPRRPDGGGPDVDVLPGAENLDQIKDIEYFKKKMIAPMKIPFSRVGIGEGSGEANDKSLSQSSSEFAKAVQWIQREMVSGLTKVAIVHLALRGYSVEDIKGFELAMSATSAMEELYRIETWQTRVAVMAELKELGWFPKEWIITHFTDLTPDEIQELKEMEAIEAMGGTGGGESEGGGGGGGMGAAPGGDMPDMGGDADVDMGGDMGGDANDPLAAEGDEPELPEDGVDLGESGFDRRAQRKVLTEMRLLQQGNNRRLMTEYVTRLAVRLGKDTERPRARELNSQFDYLVEQNELDGLADLAGTVIVDYSHNPERQAALSEVRDVITGGVSTLVESDEITARDMPAQTCGVSSL